MSEGDGIGPVLLVDLARGFGGAEMRVVDTAKALFAHLDCSLVALTDSPLHQRATASGIPVHPISFHRQDPRIVGAIRGVIRSRGYRIVDAHNVQSQLWGIRAAAAERVPGLVSTVHSEYRFENPGLKGRAHEQVLRANASRGASFIAVSDGIARYLRSVVGTRPRIELIRRGFPVPSPPVGDMISRSDLGWSEQELVVGVVGRLAIAKGHAVLIEALSALRDDGIMIRCYLAGDGAERKNLEDRVRSLGLVDRIHFAGFREDVGSVLGLMDVLCLPSLSEGLPNVVLEACAARVPLVATRVGEIPALLRDGEDALLVPPNDPVALAGAMRRALESTDRLSLLAESAHQRLTRLLSADWTAQTIEHYRKAQTRQG